MKRQRKMGGRQTMAGTNGKNAKTWKPQLATERRRRASSLARLLAWRPSRLRHSAAYRGDSGKRQAGEPGGEKAANEEKRRGENRMLTLGCGGGRAAEERPNIEKLKKSWNGRMSVIEEKQLEIYLKSISSMVADVPDYTCQRGEAYE